MSEQGKDLKAPAAQTAVIDFEKARLEGRDHDALLGVIRTLERLRLADGKPLHLSRNGVHWILLFGRVEETSGASAAEPPPGEET